MELFVVEGPDAGRSFALGAQSVIGRDPTAAVHLTDEEVSRRHALITPVDDGAQVEDLGSVNGTHLDDGEVEGEARVRVGERLRVGQTVLELRQIEDQDPEAMKPTKASLRRPE